QATRAPVASTGGQVDTPLGLAASWMLRRRTGRPLTLTPEGPARPQSRRVTPSQRGVVSAKTAADSRSAPVEPTLALFPARPIERGTRTHEWGWEGATCLPNQSHLRARNRQ